MERDDQVAELYDHADWQQQLEVEQYRYESAVAALNRCAKAGAKVEDLKFLASEAGITNYEPERLT